MKIFFENNGRLNESLSDKIASSKFSMEYIKGVAKQLLMWSYSEYGDIIKRILSDFEFESCIKNVGRVVGRPDLGCCEWVFELDGTYDDNKRYIDALMKEIRYYVNRYTSFGDNVIFDFLDGDKSSLLVRAFLNGVPNEDDVVNALLSFCDRIFGE